MTFHCPPNAAHQRRADALNIERFIHNARSLHALVMRTSDLGFNRPSRVSSACPVDDSARGLQYFHVQAVAL